jgi:hypothetical protein
LGGPIGTLCGTYLYKYGGYLTVFGVSACLQFGSLAYIISTPESRGPFSKFDQNGNRIVKDEKPNLLSTTAVPPKESGHGKDEKKARDDVKTNCSQLVNKKMECELKEKTCGPQADVGEKITVKKMFTDLIDYHRLTDSFQSTFRKREGNARTFVLLLITCNLLRRLGRGKNPLRYFPLSRVKEHIMENISNIYGK